MGLAVIMIDHAAPSFFCAVLVLLSENDEFRGLADFQPKDIGATIVTQLLV